MDKSGKVEGGKARLGRDEGRRLVERWRSSGLIASEFCRRHHVPVHVLRYWASGKARGGAGSHNGRDFFVLTAGPQTDGASTPKIPAEKEAALPLASKAVVIVVPLLPGATALADALKVVLREVAP